MVGVPAPFGREDAFVKYVDPDPKFDQSVQWLPVHQGPESLLPERIKLNFAGEREYDERIDSGFGPYGLCRLTSETGGLYFTVHPNRKVGEEVPSWETAAYSSHLAAFFDERVMRNYRPDYVTVDQYYELHREESRVRVAGRRRRSCRGRRRWKTSAADSPRSTTPSWPAICRVAQRDAAKLEPQINQLVSILRQGEAGSAEDHQAALAGRLRPGDGPGAGGEGPHRGLQRDAGRGQAGAASSRIPRTTPGSCGRRVK